MTLNTNLPESMELEQRAQRQAVGLYTLDEALGVLCANVQILNPNQFKTDLKALVKLGKVKVSEPNKTTPMTPPIKVRGFYEEASWDELNAHWLSTYRDIDWRFPSPQKKITYLSSDKWHELAYKYQDEHRLQNPKLLEKDIAHLVYERFLHEGIQFSHGGGGEITEKSIVTILSKRK